MANCLALPADMIHQLTAMPSALRNCVANLSRVPMRGAWSSKSSIFARVKGPKLESRKHAVGSMPIMIGYDGASQAPPLWRPLEHKV